MEIYLVINISWVARYREQVERQKIEEVEVDKVKEWKVNKILNQRKIRKVVKYLVQWKRFTVEYNI